MTCCGLCRPLLKYHPHTLGGAGRFSDQPSQGYPRPVAWCANRIKPPADPATVVRRYFYTSKMQSAVKQNLHLETEADINKLANLLLGASYTYLSLGMFFDRDDVALPNFSRFFLERSVKERDQAEKLLEYQNTRGGRVLLQTIAKPSREDWKGGLDALSFSLGYQKTLNTCILDVHRRAGSHTDPHFCDFLEQHFIADSHDTIKKLGDYQASLTRMMASEPHGAMGEYLFDKHTL